MTMSRSLRDANKTHNAWHACLLLWVLFLNAGTAVANEDVPASTDTPTTLAEAKAAYERYSRPGYSAEALKHARRAVELAEEDATVSAEEKARLMLNLGTSLTLVRDDNAIYVLDDVLKRYRELYGASSEQIIDVLLARGDAQLVVKDALVEYNDALGVADAVYGEKSPLYYEVMLLVGTGLFDRHRSERAGRYLAKAYKGFAKVLPEADIRRARAAYERGRFEHSLRHQSKAVKYLKEAALLFDAAGFGHIGLNLSAHTLLAVNYEGLGNSEEATRHLLVLGKNAPPVGDAEILPIYRKIPKYPYDAFSRGQEGKVVFLFTVKADGTVADIEITGGENMDVFGEAATEAVSGFRFAPRFVEGKAVDRPNVSTSISFRVE